MRIRQGVEAVVAGEWAAVLAEAAERHQALVGKMAMAEEFLHLLRSTADRAATGSIKRSVLLSLEVPGTDQLG